MKTTTFKINNNCSTTISKNYSKILDNIIETHILDTNPYLKKNTICLTDTYDNDKSFIESLFAKKSTTPCYLNCSLLKSEDSDFTKAANFLANYKKNNTKLYFGNTPIIFGKTYKLIDGTPIIFYDDEIQIGFDTYSYNNFGNIKFLNTLATNTKKTIIDIFIKKSLLNNAGISITIK